LKIPARQEEGHDFKQSTTPLFNDIKVYVRQFLIEV
jgi:hypothetical protein